MSFTVLHRQGGLEPAILVSDGGGGLDFPGLPMDDPTFVASMGIAQNGQSLPDGPLSLSVVDGVITVSSLKVNPSTQIKPAETLTANRLNVSRNFIAEASNTRGRVTCEPGTLGPGFAYAGNYNADGQPKPDQWLDLTLSNPENVTQSDIFKFDIDFLYRDGGGRADTHFAEFVFDGTQTSVRVDLSQVNALDVESVVVRARASRFGAEYLLAGYTIPEERTGAGLQPTTIGVRTMPVTSAMMGDLVTVTGGVCMVTAALKVTNPFEYDDPEEVPAEPTTLTFFATGDVNVSPTALNLGGSNQRGSFVGQ